MTADTAGIPFTVTGSTTDGDASNTQTLTVNTTVAASGPNLVDLAANWSTAAAPANTDDIVFEHSDVDCLYNLDALAAIIVNSLTINQSYTGKIGLARMNDSDYLEYRPTSLNLGSNTVTIGLGDGQGSGRINLDAAASNTAVTIYNSGSALEDGIPAILLEDTGAAAIVNIYKGDVGIAFLAGETASVATLRVGYVENQQADAIVTCGSGTTLTTIVKTGGSLDIRSNVTTITQDAGDLTIGGAATVTTLNLNAGTLYDQSTGTFATVNVLGGAVYDLRRSLAAKTITQLNLYDKAAFYDPQGFATVTNGFDLPQTRLFTEDGQPQTVVVRPRNKTWTESAI